MLTENGALVVSPKPTDIKRYHKIYTLFVN